MSIHASPTLFSATGIYPDKAGECPEGEGMSEPRLIMFYGKGPMNPVANIIRNFRGPTVFWLSRL